MTAFLARTYRDISWGVVAGWDVVRDNAWVVYLGVGVMLVLAL